MKSLPLFLLGVIAIIQVHAEIKGFRRIGDYPVDQREPVLTLSPAKVNIVYPRLGYPSRPEIITCFDLRPSTKPNLILNELLDGIGSTGYKLTMTDGPYTLYLVVFGKAPIETSTTGTLSRDDKLFHIEIITKAALPNKIIVVNLKYPKVANSTATITWISVMDERNNDPASIKVARGGVGFDEVHLQLSSRVGRAMNFTVQIYGKNFTSDSWPWYSRYNAASDALLFDQYWPWDFSNVTFGRHCGCRTGRVFEVAP